MRSPKPKPTRTKAYSREDTFRLEDMIYPTDGGWNRIQAFASRGPGGRPMVTLQFDLGRETITVDLNDPEVQGLASALRQWLEEHSR